MPKILLSILLVLLCSFVAGCDSQSQFMRDREEKLKVQRYEAALQKLRSAEQVKKMAVEAIEKVNNEGRYYDAMLLSDELKKIEKRIADEQKFIRENKPREPFFFF